MPATQTSSAISLSDTGWLKRPELARILEVLGAAEGQTRIVGGAVRDALLGRTPGEIDLATALDPETVMARAVKAGIKAVPTGISHGTVTLATGAFSCEVTTLRVDVETYGRHADVAFTGDWEEDARRRDFTMNALYADADGSVHDPLGGHADILSGRVRFIGDAEARITEDYLRILRYFRFQAWYGRTEPDPEALAACIRARTGLRTLSAERIGHEMVKLLGAPQPGAALEAMYDSGILTLVLKSVPHIAPFMRLLQIEAEAGIAPDALTRLGILGCLVEEDAERIAESFRLSGKQRARLEAPLAHHALPAPSDDDGLKELLYRSGAQTYRDAVLRAWSHRPETDRDKQWRSAHGLPERWSVPALPWSGGDDLALGVPAGKQVGQVLKKAEADWIAQGFPAERPEQERILARAAGTAS